MPQNWCGQTLFLFQVGHTENATSFSKLQTREYEEMLLFSLSSFDPCLLKLIGLICDRNMVCMHFLWTFHCKPLSVGNGSNHIPELLQ